MRQCILFFTVTVSFYVGLLAQEHEYVPLVREGVRWNYLHQAVDYYYNVEYYVYTMQFNGDSIINGREYKNLFCTFEGTRYLVAFMREQDKRVYGIRVSETCDNIEMKYDFELFGWALQTMFNPIEHFNSMGYSFITQLKTDKEMQLYDFNLINPIECDVMEIGGKLRYVNTNFIEGIGPICENGGDFLNPWPPLYACFCSTPLGLACVTSADGIIEFKTETYDKALSRVKGYRMDLNHDGTIDVTDVNIVIDIVLGKDSNDNYGGRADLTGEGTVDVSDINSLIDIVLGK